MRVAILYICTGRYRMFWEQFRDSVRANFMPGIDKTFFVWHNTPIRQEDDVVLTFRKKKSRVMENFDRWAMFNQRREELLKYDYVFFFNANSRVASAILPEEIIPDAIDSDIEICAAVYPQNFKGDPDTGASLGGPFEQRKEYWACIDDPDITTYAQGGFNGGKAEAFMEMSSFLEAKTMEEIAKGLIPIYADESMLNKYLEKRKWRKLNPSYLWQGFYCTEFPKKVEILNKRDYGGLGLFLVEQEPVHRCTGLKARITVTKQL